MSNKFYIGVDNGVTGTISIVNTDGTWAVIVGKPIKIVQNYTSAKKNITRIDFPKYCQLFQNFMQYPAAVRLERPMVNEKRFFATQSALRCLEAELAFFENYPQNWSFSYIDSKEWQSHFFGKASRKRIKDGDKKTKSGNQKYKYITEERDLKALSLQKGNELFPLLQGEKFKDRDSLLIAEFIRLKNL